MLTRDIPHPPSRIPWVGDLKGVSRERTPIQDTLRMGRGLGPIFTRQLLGRQLVIVAGAELAGELADESRFAKHVSLGLEALRAAAGDALFTAYNDEPNWHAAHAVLHSSFSAASMRLYHPAMLAAVEELVASWTDRAGTPVDAGADMTTLTLETIGRAGFDFSFGSFAQTEQHPFVAAMVRVMLDAQAEAFRPGWWPFGQHKERHEADIAHLNGVVDDVIAARRAAGDTRTDDLLGRMLHSPAPQTGLVLDDVNIRRQVITFLIAGHETAAGSLTFALYHLLAHPEVLAKAQAEVDEQWAGVDVPEYKDVAKLRYVRRVFDESLRLWPTAPIYAREAREDTLLAGRWPMAQGDAVRIFLPLVHRDPAWGPAPDTFDPDRFRPELVKARPAHAYKPFGTGDRACIGRQFALHESVLALGTILRNFDLEPPPGPPYRLRIRELLTLRPDGLRLVPQRRGSALGSA